MHARAFRMQTASVCASFRQGMRTVSSSVASSAKGSGSRSSATIGWEAMRSGESYSTPFAHARLKGIVRRVVVANSALALFESLQRAMQPHRIVRLQPGESHGEAPDLALTWKRFGLDRDLAFAWQLYDERQLDASLLFVRRIDEAPAAAQVI